MRIGLDSLDWLVQIQQSETGWNMPIGNRGFYPRGGEKSSFDQQPVAVYSLISASLDACRAIKDPLWYDRAKQAYEWFFGRNALGLPVYDQTTGGCRDGLHIDRMNENQGAESTLSFLQAYLEMQKFKRESPVQASSHGREHQQTAPRFLIDSSKTT